MVEALLRAGADVNAVTNTWKTDAVFGANSGQTPLHWAAAAGHSHVVADLLLAGSFTSAEDERGRLPQGVANDARVKRSLAQAEAQSYVCVEFETETRGFAADAARFGSLFAQQSQ